MKKLNDSELVNVCGGIIIKFVPAPGSGTKYLSYFIDDPIRVTYHGFCSDFYRINYIALPGTTRNRIADIMNAKTRFPELEEAEAYARAHGWPTNQQTITVRWDFNYNSNNPFQIAS